jgi:hypothetical protein
LDLVRLAQKIPRTCDLHATPTKVFFAESSKALGMHTWDFLTNNYFIQLFPVFIISAVEYRVIVTIIQSI